MNADAKRAAATLATCALLAGCASKAGYDYTNFRQHPPRSILILPPLNNSTTIEGTYSYLSTVSEPVAERGYYVYPVAVIDQYLKENGMPTAGEMQQIPLPKVTEIIGADAVLYTTLLEYGSKYRVVMSVATVSVKATLVDARSGLVLWEGVGTAHDDSGGSGNLLVDAIAAAVTQAVSSTTDSAHAVSRVANQNLFLAEGRALPYGPYSPKFGSK